MVELSFYLLVILCAGIVVWSLRNRTGFLELPTLTAIVMLGWAVPQLWQIGQGISELESSAYVQLNLMCFLCMLATVVGWTVGQGSVGGQFDQRDHTANFPTLIKITIVITAVSWVMMLAIGAQDAEVRNNSQWTGLITVLYFFSNLKVLSLFISAYLVLRTGKPIAWALLIANIALYLPLLVVFFRRRAMVEFLGVLALAYWFAKGRIIPRVAVLTGVPLGMFVVFGIGALRRVAFDKETGEWRMPTLANVAEIDFWAETPFATARQAPEMLNALSIVRYADEFAAHTWGMGSWNRLVFQWVPAQFVGADVKAGLMFNIIFQQNVFETFWNEQRTGSTSSGMGDAYMELGIFGFVFFALTAFVMGRWWRKANRGNFWAAALYAAGLAPALIMPTSYAVYFFNFMLLLGGFLFACKWVLQDPRAAQRQAIAEYSAYQAAVASNTRMRTGP